MKYLAIDYGQKRTGLAVSDPEERMAFPARHPGHARQGRLFRRTARPGRKRGHPAFVVGLPLRSQRRGQRNHPPGAQHGRPPGPPHRSARVPFMPELLSSHEAESRLRQAGTVQGDLRLVDMAALPDVQLTDAEALEDDDAQE